MDCVVIGTEHHNTLGVIRSLGESNIHPSVYLKKSNKAFVEKSKYASKYSFFSDDESLLSLLLREGEEIIKKSIVISCYDKASEIIDAHKDCLSKYYVLPGMYGKYCIHEVQDKIAMMQIAGSVGLTVPRTFILPKDIDKVTYPCISKPVNSNIGGKSQIRVFFTKEELLRFWNQSDSGIFVQELIEKKEEVQFIGCSLDGNNIIIPGMSKIIRSQHNTNTGYLSYSKVESDYESTLKKSIEFIKHLGYRGLFSVEFIRDKNGLIYFLEANFRNDGNSYVVTKAGINLPTIWYRYNCGFDVSNYNLIPRTIRFMPEFQDFHFVKTGKINWFKWLCEFGNSKAHSVWSLKDREPFIECIKEIRKGGMNIG